MSWKHKVDIFKIYIYNKNLFQFKILGQLYSFYILSHRKS
jgi:hypothetical protein